jgi:hypothetical protein
MWSRLCDKLKADQVEEQKQAAEAVKQPARDRKHAGPSTPDFSRIGRFTAST